MSNDKSQWSFPGAEDANFWCQTDGDQTTSVRKRSRLAWEIKNFNDRTEQKGTCIRSNEFIVIGQYTDVATKWSVRVYPKGKKDSEEGNICISLQNDSYVDVNARGLLMIVNGENGKKIISLEDEYLRHGWKRENKNVSLADGYWLHGDNLIVIVEIVVFPCMVNSCLELCHDLTNAYTDKDPMVFDVTVKCGDATFECNKFMMTSRSPVFKSMFKSNMIESQTNIVNIVDLQPKVVKGMLQYIHTGICSDKHNISPQDLLVAADRYQLEKLKVSCQEKLIHSLAVDNCITTLILSDVYNATDLRDPALQFVSKNIKAISKSCDWKKELAAYPSLMADMIEKLSTMNDSLTSELKRFQEKAD